MKTDELVALLSNNVEPVDRNAVVRTLSVAIAGAALAALGTAFAGLGFRPDLTTTGALVYVAIKLAFTIGVVGLAMIYLMKLARPGGERMMSPFVIAVPFLAVVILAAISLWSAPPAHWERMIVGDEDTLTPPSDAEAMVAAVPDASLVRIAGAGHMTNLEQGQAFEASIDDFLAGLPG